MKPSVIVWDLETVPDLGGFVAILSAIRRSARILREGTEVAVELSIARIWPGQSRKSKANVTRAEKANCVRL